MDKASTKKLLVCRKSLIMSGAMGPYYGRQKNMAPVTNNATKWQRSTQEKKKTNHVLVSLLAGVTDRV